MEERLQPITSSELLPLWWEVVAGWMEEDGGGSLWKLCVPAYECMLVQLLEIHPTAAPSLPEVSRGLVRRLLGSRLRRRLFAKNKWTRSRRPHRATWAAKHLSLCLMGERYNCSYRLSNCSVLRKSYTTWLCNGFLQYDQSMSSVWAQWKHVDECKYEYMKNIFILLLLFISNLNLPFHLHFTLLLWPPLNHPFAFSLPDWII